MTHRQRERERVGGREGERERETGRGRERGGGERERGGEREDIHGKAPTSLPSDARCLC